LAHLLIEKEEHFNWYNYKNSRTLIRNKTKNPTFLFF